MNTETIIEKFEAQEIAFDLFQGDLMVNATEMAKPFKRRLDHFLTNEQTKELKKALIEDRMRELNYPESRVVEDQILVTKEGKHGGTFMCEDLALAFAMWLSPKFHVWVLKTVRKIIFGNNSALVREAVYNLPRLNKKARPKRKKLSRMKMSILGSDATGKLRDLIDERKTVLAKIEQLTYRSVSPELWDNPEILGSEMVKWGNRREELSREILEITLAHEKLLAKDEYMSMRREVDAITDQMKFYSATIRNCHFSDN